MRTVLFPHTSPLLLERVQRNPDGTIKAGDVVNGGWRFEVRGNECGLDPHDSCEDPRIALHNLARFAALVASTEREAWEIERIKKEES